MAQRNSNVCPITCQDFGVYLQYGSISFQKSILNADNQEKNHDMNVVGDMNGSESSFVVS